MLEQPSADLDRIVNDRKRAVQDAKLDHLAEEDVPGAVLIEDPSPSLGDPHRQKS